MVFCRKIFLLLFSLAPTIYSQDEGPCESRDLATCPQRGASVSDYAVCVWCGKNSSCLTALCSSNFSDVEEQCVQIIYYDDCEQQKEEDAFSDLWIIIYIYAVVSGGLATMIVSQVVPAKSVRCAKVLTVISSIVTMIALIIATFKAVEIWVGALIATIPLMLFAFLSILMICSTVAGPDMMIWPVAQLVLLCLALGFLFSIGEPDKLSEHYQHLWVTVLAIVFGFFACCLLFSARIVRAKAQDAPLMDVQPPFPFHLKTFTSIFTSFLWISFLVVSVFNQAHRKSCSAAYVTFITAFVSKFMYDDMNTLSKLWILSVILTVFEAFSTLSTLIIEFDSSIDDDGEDIPSLISSSIALVVLCILVWHILYHRNPDVYASLRRERTQQTVAVHTGVDTSAIIRDFHS